ncbi:hypothetical protein M501DRAFT_996278 [Patellaria atrata CBS 101060]|uniref:Uncharacterized protein n=1 Tax=Patellaria atrata CBS 101060 TaxID=1346257 RepID=A0A9P4VL48_9PEZI|nr:hypothetical protein M501DRAFT_996278 [Patellaria atrata CBS 101060]
MLQKFCVLLNNKKLKIRDQQRLLATAKVDPDAGEYGLVWDARHTANSSTAAQVSSSRGGARTRKAGASRTGKRKANEANAVPESEGDPGESDHRKAENELDEDMEAATTPERTDDKTADEDEDDIAPEGDLPEGIGASKGKSAVRSGLEDSRNSSSPEAPPPRRDLPFAKHKTRQSAPEPVKEAPKAAASTNNGDESTDDDEL